MAKNRGYVVYQSGRGFNSLAAAKKAAKAESKQYGRARVERLADEKTVAEFSNGTAVGGARNTAASSRRRSSIPKSVRKHKKAMKAYGLSGSDIHYVRWGGKGKKKKNAGKPFCKECGWSLPTHDVDCPARRKPKKGKKNAGLFSKRKTKKARGTGGGNFNAVMKSRSRATKQRKAARAGRNPVEFGVVVFGSAGLSKAGFKTKEAAQKYVKQLRARGVLGGRDYEVRRIDSAAMTSERVNPAAGLNETMSGMKPGYWYDTTLSGAKVKVKRAGSSLIVKPAAKRK
jgi:hypothetical protein